MYLPTKSIGRLQFGHLIVEHLHVGLDHEPYKDIGVFGINRDCSSLRSRVKRLNEKPTFSMGPDVAEKRGVERLRCGRTVCGR